MNAVESVDHHIRFNADWGGHSRFVFIPLDYVEADAGRALSRSEAIDFVRDHLDRYRSEAETMDANGDRTVTVERA